MDIRIAIFNGGVCNNYIILLGVTKIRDGMGQSRTLNYGTELNWTRKPSYSDYSTIEVNLVIYCQFSENIKINLRFRSGTDGLNEELVLGTVVEATILCRSVCRNAEILCRQP